ncbi:MAG: GtrA-like protein [Bacteroidetes bacterium ADurb.Bin408]|nr:MAG: GtrA-like protein [Bacteroidetes bacterium ADurb.Bin408]
MKKKIKKAGRIITVCVDFFYPPFSKYMSLQFFRYAVTGGINLVFDWMLYFLIYNFVLQKQMLFLGFVTISSHIATFIIKMPVVLLSGFLLQKYVTFTYSDIRGRIQLFRYFVIFAANIILNYAGLKLFVDVLDLFPTPAFMIVSVISVLFSYVSQKRYTFKKRNIQINNQLPNE